MTVPAFQRREILAPGTVITASGSSGAQSLGVDTVAALHAYASITAISGTGASITFGIEFDTDASGDDYPPVAFGTATNGTAQTAVGSDVLVASATQTANPADGLNPTRYYRLVWTVAGTTPSITIGALYTDN